MVYQVQSTSDPSSMRVSSEKVCFRHSETIGQRRVESLIDSVSVQISFYAPLYSEVASTKSGRLREFSPHTPTARDRSETEWANSDLKPPEYTAFGRFRLVAPRLSLRSRRRNSLWTSRRLSVSRRWFELRIWPKKTSNQSNREKQ